MRMKNKNKPVCQEQTCMPKWEPPFGSMHHALQPPKLSNHTQLMEATPHKLATNLEGPFHHRRNRKPKTQLLHKTNALSGGRALAFDLIQYSPFRQRRQLSCQCIAVARSRLASFRIQNNLTNLSTVTVAFNDMDL